MPFISQKKQLLRETENNDSYIFSSTHFDHMRFFIRDSPIQG